MSYARDAAGQRTAMTDPHGTTSYVYDLLRRLTRVTDAAGKTVGYGYDRNGNRSALRYPDGTRASYAYDALDRLVSLADGAGGTTTYRYDAAGNETAASFANGTQTRRTYDALDRLTSIATLDPRGHTASRFAYTYDALGNVTSERTGGDEADARGTSYAYDALSRLLSVQAEDQRTAYRYDPVGNRIGVFGDDGEDAVAAVFDAADQLTALTSAGGETLARFSYDPNGNLVAQSGAHSRTYSYDAADRLRSVTDRRASTTYTYDGDGALTGETTSPARDRDQGHDEPPAPATLRYTIDRASPLPQILAATDGTATTRYLYANARIASLGPLTRYYATDVRGSVRSLSDERGKRVATFRYDAWGTPQGAGEARRDERDAGLARLFGFTGERQDEASGLTYLRARWYAPAAGRFLTADAFHGSAADPRTLHRYAYALDDPTSRVDPTGFSSASLVDGAAGYAYDGTAFYADPTAGATTALRQLGRDAAYAVAGTFADLGSPDLGTKAAAFAKVGVAGVAIAAPIALALPEEAVASGAAMITMGASAIAAGATALWQKAQSVLPWSNRAIDARASSQAAYAYATQADKLDHIFQAGHRLEPLVARFGSREAVMREILDVIKGQTPAAGVFEITTNIAGETLIVRRAVVDGVTKIGTAFVP